MTLAIGWILFVDSVTERPLLLEGDHVRATQRWGVWL